MYSNRIFHSKVDISDKEISRKSIFGVKQINWDKVERILIDLNSNTSIIGVCKVLQRLEKEGLSSEIGGFNVFL